MPHCDPYCSLGRLLHITLCHSGVRHVVTYSEMMKIGHGCLDQPDMMPCWLLLAQVQRVTFFFCCSQVCMNSGKVRLNSGILERRRSNWSGALHHFRMARQIDDTYCEPDYWIGATLLQQGSHLDLGVQVRHPPAPPPPETTVNANLRTLPPPPSPPPPTRNNCQCKLAYPTHPLLPPPRQATSVNAKLHSLSPLPNLLFPPSPYSDSSSRHHHSQCLI